MMTRFTNKWFDKIQVQGDQVFQDLIQKFETMMQMDRQTVVQAAPEVEDGSYNAPENPEEIISPAG